MTRYSNNMFLNSLFAVVNDVGKITMDFFLGVQLHFTIDLYKLLIESIRFRSSSKRNFFAKGY